MSKENPTFKEHLKTALAGEDLLNDLIRDYLKKNLRVSILNDNGYYHSGFKVVLELEGEKLSEDSFTLSHHSY